MKDYDDYDEYREFIEAFDKAANEHDINRPFWWLKK